MLINVNGQEYSGWEDIPADVRASVAAGLPDANGNGVPDLFEGDLTALPPGTRVESVTSVVVDGREFRSMDELPPEVREMFRKFAGESGPGNASVDATNSQAATTIDGLVEPKKSWWRRLFG